MEIMQTELDVSSMLRFIGIVVEVVGKGWLQKKIIQAQSRLKPRKIRKFKHSFEANTIKHPLVDWFLEYDKWRQQALETKRMVLSPNIIELSLLGKHLGQTRLQKGFEKLVDRLKDSIQFYSAAFEVEAAASYTSKGWEVEFIEEGTEKTPDLKVIKPDGFVFWVECKRKDALTRRDKYIESIWQELETSLLNYLGPRKLNYLIEVNAKSDPERRDIEYLRRMILETIEAEENLSEPKSNKTTSIEDHRGRFEILFQKLSAPDEEIKMDKIGLEVLGNFDRIYLGAEIMMRETGESITRNPIKIALKTATPPDRVSVVVNLLKAAVAQLPSDGPGVIWIRIPDRFWENNLSESFERVERLLQKELTGEMNRRVNAVFVITRIFAQVKKNGMEGLAYRPIIMRVNHVNPRSLQ